MNAPTVPRRGGLARRAVVFGGLERAIMSAIAFARIPLLLWGLGVRDYGVWMAVLGVVTAANLLDFGLHFGLTNTVAHATGADDWVRVRHAIATAFLAYASIAAAAGIVLIAGFDAWHPAVLLHIAPERPRLIHTLVTLGIITLVTPLPLKAYAAALTGCQEQWIVSVFRLLLSLVQITALFIVLAVFHFGIEGVAWTGLVTEIGGWCGLALWVEARRPRLRIHLAAASKVLARPLLATSLTFLTINLANLFKSALGNTIVANALGPEAVAAFSVPLSMFVTALGIAAMVASSLWPAFGEASARGDWRWIEQAFTFGTKCSLGVATSFAILGTLFGADVIAIWAPAAGKPPVGILSALGVWLVSQAGINAASTLLNGTGRLRTVTVASLAEGAVVFAGSVAVVGRWGPAGVAFVMATAGILNAVFLLALGIPRGTAGHVAAPTDLLARLGAAVVLSAAPAWVLSHALRGAAPIARLAFGAAPTALLVTATVWFLLLTANDRARVLNR